MSKNENFEIEKIASGRFTCQWSFQNKNLLTQKEWGINKTYTRHFLAEEEYKK